MAQGRPGPRGFLASTTGASREDARSCRAASRCASAAQDHAQHAERWKREGRTECGVEPAPIEQSSLYREEEDCEVGSDEPQLWRAPPLSDQHRGTQHEACEMSGEQERPEKEPRRKHGSFIRHPQLAPNEGSSE